MKAFVGIDPGLTGALAVIDRDGALLCATRTPLIAEDDYDLRAMVELLTSWRERWPLIVALEDVGAARVAGRQQGGSSMFTFGEGKGIWKGIIAALGLPRVDVRPEAWSRSLLAGLSKEIAPVHVERKDGETDAAYAARVAGRESSARQAKRKSNAVQRAMALWPSMPIRFKRDWAMADAALIAECARRSWTPAPGAPSATAA